MTEATTWDSKAVVSSKSELDEDENEVANTCGSYSDASIRLDGGAEWSSKLADFPFLSFPAGSTEETVTMGLVGLLATTEVEEGAAVA